jgi:hypothetical protein
MLTGALVMEASWGMAKTPATRARMTVEYFMLIDDARLSWRAEIKIMDHNCTEQMSGRKRKICGRAMCGLLILAVEPLFTSIRTSGLSSDDYR